MLKGRLSIKAAAAAILLVVCLGAHGALAATAEEIETGVNNALSIFKDTVREGQEMLDRANGILVFPSVIKAGLIVGGEYGEGALRVEGQTTGYYNLAAVSFGLQVGAQSKTVILLFMTERALWDFRRSTGWKVGVDGSVAFLEVGAGSSFDTASANSPILGFVLNNQGIMVNLTLEGAKITRITR